MTISVFALTINSHVTGVTNLTSTQIKGIYSGKIKNWNQVGGPNLPIVIISRPPDSDTRAIFQQYILGGPETFSGPSNLITDNPNTIVQNIEDTPGAIAYLPLGSVKKAGVTILSIDGHAPDKTLVENNTYKFWDIEHMYTKGPGNGLSQALIGYMLSTQGKQAAFNLDFIPISSMSSSALQAH